MSIESKLAKKAVEKKTTSTAKLTRQSGAGRPSVIDERVLSKLEEGFMMGLTDVECCLYVDIWTKTLYRYIEANPEFWHRKEELKHNLKMVAKANLNKTIKAWDSIDSKWYLERKGKDEFSLKQEIEQHSTIDMNINIGEVSDEELDKLISG